jgi:hypothetical protein
MKYYKVTKIITHARDERKVKKKWKYRLRRETKE